MQVQYIVGGKTFTDREEAFAYEKELKNNKEINIQRVKDLSEINKMFDQLTNMCERYERTYEVELTTKNGRVVEKTPFDWQAFIAEHI